METTKIPLSSCIESKHQNRVGLGDVTGLARSIEVNGQITPLIVVADGDSYQLVAGHRRTAAMKSLGLEEADAYVMDGWDDARIAQILNAENNHRKELTEAERGRGIQTMLSLGVPVSDAAVSADVPEEIAADEAYEQRTSAYDAMQGRIVEFAKDALPNCVPDLPWGALREGYEVTSYWLDELFAFISFIDDVLMPAGYELSEDERDLMEHLHGLFAGDDEDEVFGEDEATEDAPEADDECPLDADTIDGEYLDGHLVIAKAGSLRLPRDKRC